MNEKFKDNVPVITVEDASKIKFARVHRPERTKTIQTIASAASRRPSVSAPKRPQLKAKTEKKNVDIVSIACASYPYFRGHLPIIYRLSIY
jgi:sodium/potassium-transporting ATPase subunit alpha